MYRPGGAIDTANRLPPLRSIAFKKVSPLIGKTLAHYEILEKIGRGGMGEVYRARDTRLDREIALKVLPEKLAGEGDWRHRFEREAKAVAALKHPNIVTLHSVEESGAKLVEPVGDVEGATTAFEAGVTAKGQILGTANYMSPEQAEGKTIDHRSDIFSLGVLFYEMLTGDRPFAGDTPVSTISSILKDVPPSITTRKAMLPRHLGRIVQRCLEKNPDKRYQTARDVCNKLEGLREEVASGEWEVPASGGVAPGHTRGQARVVWAGIAAVVVIVAGFFGMRALRTPSVVERGDVTIRPLTSFAGVEYSGSWSPDGGFFAYSHTGSGPLNISVVATAGGDPISLVESPYDDAAPAWSPDNRWVAFVSHRDGTADLVLGAQPWSPDGKSLLLARQEEGGGLAVWSIAVGSGTQNRMTHPASDSIDGAASWSPDGTSFFFNRRTAERSGIWIADADGENARLIAGSEGLFGTVWSPDGRNILCMADAEEGTGEILELNIASGRRRSLTSGTNNMYATSVTSSGRILIGSSSHQTDLYVRNLEDATEKRLTRHTRDNFMSTFSPDGSRLAYMSTRTGDPEIWILDLESDTERRLTDQPGRDWAPDWSRDGREILFISERGGSPDLWIQGVESGVLRRLRDGAGEGEISTTAVGARWSPSGEKVGRLARGDEALDLWTVRSDGSDPKQVLTGVRDFDWYVDDTMVIYTPLGAGGTRGNELRVANLNTGDTAVLLDLPHIEIRVASDGSAVSFCTALSHFNMNLQALPLLLPDSSNPLPRPAGEVRTIADGEGLWHVHNGGWSPDGSSVVYTRDTDTGDLHVLDGVY